MRGLPARTLLAWCIIVGGLGVVAMATCFAVDLFRLEPGPTNTAAVQSEAQRVYDAIVSFHQDRGRYPKSLAEIGIDSDSIKWGGWNYSTSWSGDKFELTLGNYNRYNFVLWRDEDDKEWNWDG